GTNTASPQWSIPDGALGAVVRLKVAHPTDANVFSISANTFKVKGNFVNIRLDPDPGADGAKVGQSYTIRWDRIGPVVNVLLRYSRTEFDIPANIFSVTPGAVANSGSYSWQMADKIALGWKIRVIDNSDDTVSNTMTTGFKIRGDFEITNPTTGTTWKVDESHPVTWTTKGSITAIAIDYSKDGNNWVYN
ncbi:MAG: hypothetical protein QME51_01915, partial [Planctomycetota bacterium]|nr:hypothetical protein [Planctomycetota bacterium]